MSGSSLEKRLDTASAFASGHHPLIAAAYYSSQQPHEVEPLPPSHQEPIIPFPKEFSQRQLDGDKSTEAIFQAHEQTGEPLVLYDGFHLTLHTHAGPFLVLIDSDITADPFLAGMVHKAKEQFSTHPHWDIHRKMFEIGTLCFGNWGQKRYPLSVFQKAFSTQSIVLGELLYRTTVSDLDCAPMSLGMQAIAQRCGIPSTMHIGEGARYSMLCRGKGPHAWTIVQTDTGPITVDWTNYPPSVEIIFQHVKSNNPDKTYEIFLHRYGKFPQFQQERFPPNPDDYYRVESGEDIMAAMRHTAIYWNYKGKYLGTSHLPGGWDAIDSH